MVQRAADTARGVLYGVINAILAIPALFGYAAVIFSDGAYVDVAAPLAKAVVLSAAVHQCVFSWRSTLPFAIGQVEIRVDFFGNGHGRRAGARRKRATSRCGAVWLGVEYGGGRTGTGRRRPRAHDVARILFTAAGLGGYLAFIGLCIRRACRSASGCFEWP